MESCYVGHHTSTALKLVAQRPTKTLTAITSLLHLIFGSCSLRSRGIRRSKGFFRFEFQGAISQHARRNWTPAVSAFVFLPTIVYAPSLVTTGMGGALSATMGVEIVVHSGSRGVDQTATRMTSRIRHRTSAGAACLCAVESVKGGCGK